MTSDITSDALGKSKRRFVALDGLRGILALTVMLSHMIGVVTNWAANRPLVGAYISVTYFFFMSGFVLTYAHNRNERFLYYLLVRLARLWPLHVLATLVMVAIYYYNYRNGHYFPGAYVFSKKVLLENLSFLHGVTPHNFPLINDPSWSISIEFWASLLIPLIFIRMKPKLRFLASLLIIVLLFIKSKYGVVDSSIFGMFQFILAAAAIMMGSSIYSLLDAHHKKIIDRFPFIETALWICLFVCLTGVYAQMHNRLDFLYLLSFIPLFVVDFMGPKSPIKRFLSSPVVQFFGFISFPLYLTHMSIIIADAQYRTDSPVLSIIMAGGLAIFFAYVYASLVDPIIYNALKKKIRAVVS